MKAFDLKDRIAVVAGDGRWLRPVTLALAEFGADIVIVTKSEVPDILEGVRSMGRRGHILTRDAAKAEEVEKIVAEIVEDLGRVDILVNCFDQEFFKPALEMTEFEWLKVIEVNLHRVYYWCRAVGRHMVSRREGRIINIVSGLGERGLPHGAAYCAAKGAVIQLTRALGLEWARFNVRVNGIGPGWFEGRATAGLDPSHPLLRYIPVRRLGRPQDIGLMVVYLASEASSYVTGHTYFIDGGVMAHG